MNYVLDQLEELMVSVQNHDIAFIIFAVIALLFLMAILYLICCVHENLHDLRYVKLDTRLTDGHNKLRKRYKTSELLIYREVRIIDGNRPYCRFILRLLYDCQFAPAVLSH